MLMGVNKCVVTIFDKILKTYTINLKLKYNMIIRCYNIIKFTYIGTGNLEMTTTYKNDL